ncbi:MAG: hypothetical protein JKY42_00130 [Flavobacteriales bacterium]|nr:hypothetical protein [Flavobacteriales bacterium]
MITVKKHLSLQPLINSFKHNFENYKDGRGLNSVDYPILDTSVSALACMFYKSSNLLKFQRLMQKKLYKSNLNTQFGVTEIPSDNQFRSILSSIQPDDFTPIFKDYLGRLQRGKQLSKFIFEGKYLVALDGTEYHSSETVKCSECLKKKKNSGRIQYSHQALQAIICHPDQKQILPMMPEPIKNTDGTEKQDCEINAAKRLLPKLRSQHPRMNFIWLADSIYAPEPFINIVKENNDNFILRIKQGDHKYLYECLDTAEYESFKSIAGKNTIAYRWYYDIPLNKGKDKTTVNVIKAYVISTDKNGNAKSTIAGVWATSLTITKDNIVILTKAARARWRIENQCFNTLKNYGYNLAHNWGHVKGESFIFYILTMIAFYIHQIFELTDQLFQWCRKVCVTYEDLWSDLLGLFKLLLFDSWESMLAKCLENNGIDPPLIV